MFLLIVFIAIGVIHELPLRGASAEEDAQQKAEEIHTIASSDVIYTDQELKALYYQNLQIIDLLKEIRDLLQQQLLKE